MTKLLLLLALATAACSARVAFPSIEEVEGAPGAVAKTYAQAMGKPRADTYEQRWIIERGGMEGVFTLYLKVTPPDGMHMVAVGDLGTTLCEATLEQVHQESRMFPGKLAQQILKDLKPFFLPSPKESYRRVRAEGELALYRKEGAERELWRENKVLLTNAEITVNRWHEDRKIPASLKIRGRYNATVEIR